MTNKPELKPCPFCGSTSLNTDWITNEVYTVWCLKCGADFVSNLGEKDTYKLWNTRAEPAAPSSDEVDRDLCAVSMVFPETAQDLRAHIAALEADNKRLRDAMFFASGEMISGRFSAAHEELQAALAQTDGKAGE